MMEGDYCKKVLIGYIIGRYTDSRYDVQVRYIVLERQQT